MKAGSFDSVLVSEGGKGAWVFAPVPEDHAPPVTEHWGRTPVRATVNGKRWETSVWRSASGETLLAVPKRVRGALGPGDVVQVAIELR